MKSMFNKYLSVLDVNSNQMTIDIKSLSHLQFQHLKNIPFQNLHGIKKLGTLIDFDNPDSLLQPVLNKEGGICYNLNYSFYSFLNYLGFPCCIISCFINKSEFDHMALVVFLDVPYLVDVGFGEYFISTPMPIIPDVIHSGRSGDYRIRKIEGNYILERRWLNRNRWIKKYSFTLQPRRLHEFRERFQSHVVEDKSFRENIIFSRWNEDEQFVRLFNQYLTLYHGESKRKVKISLNYWRNVK